MKVISKDINQLFDGLFLIAGPCVIEDSATLELVANELLEIREEFKIPIIFKASYRKANRTRYNSFRGIGDKKALRILHEIKEKYQFPITTDVHETKELELLKEFVDIIQIPAFLCRQSELLEQAAQTTKIVNIKKGQFMSAESMLFAAEKVSQYSSQAVLITERGNSFGYQNLIVDMCNIPKMQTANTRVIMDCTHSLQQPNQSEGITDGDPEKIELMAKAAIAVGVNGIFIETHPDPQKAKSDGKNMLPLKNLHPLMVKLTKLHNCM